MVQISGEVLYHRCEYHMNVIAIHTSFPLALITYYTLSLNYRALFSDAVQMIFSMHCCLHLVGQPVSVGNIDRLLISYYKQDIQNGTLTTKKVLHIYIASVLSLNEVSVVPMHS